MRRSFIVSGILACFVLSVALVTQGSGIVPAIVPALVPSANKTSTTSTVFALASSSALTASTAVCTNANGDMTTTGCTANAVTSTSPVTVSAAVATDQQLMELSLTAGYLNSLGRPFTIFGAGVYSLPVSTPTMTYKIKLCTVSGCGSGTVVTLISILTTASVGNVTTVPWNLNTVATTNATGATGNLEVHGRLSIDLGAAAATADTVFNDTNTAVSSNIDLTAALFVDFTVAFSTSSTSNVGVQREGVVSPGGSTSGGGGSGAMTQISQNVLGAGAASITFSSIPATYTDLYLSLQARGDTAAQTTNVVMTFNGDGGANYDWVQSGGSTATATADTKMILSSMPAASNTANFASVTQFYIYNYTRTTFQKSALALQGQRNNSSPTVALIQTFGDWNSTAAITSVTLTPAAGNFITGTTATLWGVK
jgi:hypothetical protein